jgi:excinuclease ABC subunit B
MEFKLHAPYKPTGDQPEAIRQLVEGISKGYRDQVLLGATGTGKTFTIASLIESIQKPALVMAHNKTLAAQLYAEFKEFFPENEVEYFVSYYDYYQPEAYVPRHDLYIEKDADINEEIERLRLAATTALMSRRDVIIVASVSCIYGIGNPEAYGRVVINIDSGNIYRRNALLRQLIEGHYERNDLDLRPGTFRVRGDSLDVVPAYQDQLGYRITFFGDEVERIVEFDSITGELKRELKTIAIYPARHFITDEDKLRQAIQDIEIELSEQLARFPHQCPAFQVPPGVCIGRLPDGHGKEGHKEDRNQNLPGRQSRACLPGGSGPHGSSPLAVRCWAPNLPPARSQPRRTTVCMARAISVLEIFEAPR